MNLYEEQCFESAKGVDTSINGFENISSCESEEEELPRPETVTVVQDEFAEDSDPFQLHNSDPLSVDPLSLERSIDAPRQQIKEEQEDISEVCVKIELSDSEDEISNVSIDHMPEDDGYRSGSDEGVANKNQPNSNHLRNAESNINEEIANTLNEILVEVENTNVKKGTSAQEEPKRLQVNEVSEIQANVYSNIDLCCSEVESRIVDRFCGSEVEVSQNQPKRATKENNVVSRAMESSCLERENSNTLGNPFSETRQSLTEKIFKSCVNFPKRKEPKERIEEVEELLPLCNTERKLKVVLTRCKEAEMLVSSVKLTGQHFNDRKNNNDVPAINLSPNRGNEMNSAKDFRINEKKEKKISVLKIGRNRDANGWMVMSAGDEVSRELQTQSAKVLKTVPSRGLENDLVPGGESESETLVGRDEAINRKEVQGFSERRDELGEHQTVDGTGDTVRKCLLDNNSEGAELKRWSCFICQKSFDNPFGMSGHTGHCKRRFLKKKSSHTLTDLNEHLQVVDTYKCEICAQEFASMKGMKLHKTLMGHNNNLKKNENHLNLNTPAAQLQDLQEFEEKLLHEPRMTISNKLSSMDDQNVKQNKDYSRVLPSRTRNVYCCDLCSMRFSNGLKLQVHALQHRKQTHYLNSLKGKLHQTASKINVKERFRKGFQEHSDQHAKDKLYQCDKCPEAFYSRFDIKSHLSKHTGTRPYKLEKFGKAFCNSTSLSIHKKSHELEHKCGLCGMFFSISEQLENHKCSFTKPVTMINEASEIILQPLDSFNINSSKHNKRHLKVNMKSSTDEHISNKKNSCRICGKTVASRVSLKRHMYLHISDLKQCTFCDKKCSSSSRLKDHIRARHTFEKPYKCDFCDKAYASSNTLRLHKLNKHKKKGNIKNMIKEKSTKQHSTTQEKLVEQQKLRCQLIRKALKCSKCPAVVTTYGSLKRHHKRFHLKGKKEEPVNIYKCEHCEVSCRSGITLNRHIKQFHSGKVKYTSAFKSISSTHNEKDTTEVTITSSTAENHGNHVLDSENPLQCNFCDKSFSLSSRLKDHMHCHTLEKPYQSHLSNKPYCSSDALRVYRNYKHKLKGKGTGKLMHQCDECSSQFSTSGYLLRHKNRFHLKNTQKELVDDDKFENAASFQLIESVHQHSDHLKSGKIQGSSVSKSYSETKLIECNYCTASYNYCKNFVKHLSHDHGINEAETRKLQPEVECDLCHRFLHKSSLKRHKREVHNIEEVEQETSEYVHHKHATFQLPDNLLRHVRQTEKISSTYALSSQSDHHVKKCNTVFNQNSSLVKHKDSFHVENKKKTFDINPSRKYFKCDLCTAKYFTKTSLMRHKRSSHLKEEASTKKNSSSYALNSQSNRVNKCDPIFNQNSSLVKHKASFHVENKKKTFDINPSRKYFKCDLCTAKYFTKTSLMRHKRSSHLKEEASTKKNSSSYALNSQSNRVNKCDPIFNQNSSLVKHKASFHVENKKKTFDINPSRKYFKCNLCSAKYFNKSSLLRHKRSLHLKEETFQCSVCLKVFSSPIVLIKHHEKHFKKLNYSCSGCGKSFKQLQHMEEHMLTDCNPTSLFHCDMCSLSFQALNDLKNHKQSHKFKSSLRVVESKCKELVPKKHKCDICNKLFSRKDGVKRHKKIHENVFPYQCKICGVAFQQHYKLVLHTRTHSLRN